MPNYNQRSINRVGAGSTIPILTKSGRPCGYLQPDGVFRRKFSQWIVKPVPALALETFILDELRRRGCTRLRFIGPDGVEYRTALDHFLRAGQEIDLGFGPQIALPLDDFATVRPGAMQLSMFERR